jgi:hypothetical protein
VPQPVAQVLPVEVTTVPSPIAAAIPVVLPEVKSEVVAPKPDQQVLISPFTTTKNLSLIVVGLLLLVFMIDAVIVSRRRITRIAGRTFSHVAFLGMIVVIVLILKSGKII